MTCGSVSMARQLGYGHGLASVALAEAVAGAVGILCVPYAWVFGVPCSCSILAACTNACIVG